MGETEARGLQVVDRNIRNIETGAPLDQAVRDALNKNSL